MTRREIQHVPNARFGLAAEGPAQRLFPILGVDNLERVGLPAPHALDRLLHHTTRAVCLPMMALEQEPLTALVVVDETALNKPGKVFRVGRFR